MQDFRSISIPEPLFHRLEQIGFKSPTPIQAEAIPQALLGADILGSAQTGTGKTGAFGIPLVTYLLNKENTGTALVLLPTRELAMQVMQALKQFIGNSKIATALLIGGEPMHIQFRQLKNNPKLIVGTPGRVHDHLRRETLDLSKASFLVLDEVDRMLDMGFGIQLDAINEFIPAKRQTLMFSATLPAQIEKLANKYLTDPIRVSVGNAHSPAQKVKQENCKIEEDKKFERLQVELESREGSIIVFVNTKNNADKIAFKLRKKGYKADFLHGDLRQRIRTKVTNNFRKQAFKILVATDVAARGLDIPHINHVINYSLPQCPEDYIHRIGRTGRAGAEGNAINFISKSENDRWFAIERLIDPSIKPPKNDNKKSFKKNRNRRRRRGGFRGPKR